MKNLFKQLVVYILTQESKLILEKHKPFIISVTGNLGKTTTKDNIGQILSDLYGVEKVRYSEKSQNSEFGVCLTVLGAKNAWNNPLKWLKVITKDFWKAYKGKAYPKYLVLEVGADHPLDIYHISSFVFSDVVVLTAFPDNPVHGEFFQSVKEHMREKQYLLDTMKGTGTVIYNGDDRNLESILKNAGRDVRYLKFGFHNELNDLKINSVLPDYSSDNVLIGSRYNFQIENEKVDLEVKGVLGDAHALSLVPAILVAKQMNFEMEEILQTIPDLNKSKSRMSILSGINNSIIIDDTYNASPAAFKNAIESLNKIFIKGKKIIVAGHMAELGKISKTEHIEIGKLVIEEGDIIIFVGYNNHFYKEALVEMPDHKKVYFFDNSNSVIKFLKDESIVQQDDVVLIKGSQSARLEKVVISIISNQSDAYKVCRQEDEWKKR